MSEEIPAGFQPVDTDKFDAMIGPLFFKKEGSGIVLALRLDEKHLNELDSAHGGLLMSLADDVLGANVWFAIDRKACATTSLNCDFIAQALKGEWLEGRAEITRKTRSLVFVRGQLTVGDRVIMNASGVWKILVSDN